MLKLNKDTVMSVFLKRYMANVFSTYIALSYWLLSSRLKLGVASRITCISSVQRSLSAYKKKKVGNLHEWSSLSPVLGSGFVPLYFFSTVLRPRKHLVTKNVRFCGLTCSSVFFKLRLLFLILEKKIWRLQTGLRKISPPLPLRKGSDKIIQPLFPF